jgi:replicative DNA helicase
MLKSPFAKGLKAEEILANINKEMPHSDDAEKGVLSSLFQDSLRFDEVRFGPQAFYHESNRVVFTEMIEMNELRLPLDPVLLTNRLREKKILELAGGAGAITELFTFVPSASNFQHYAKIVQEKFSDRLAITRCAELIHQIQSRQPDETVPVTEKLREAAEEIDDTDLEVPDQTMSALISELTDEIQYNMENPGKLKGVSTGWTEIDKNTGGFYGSRLWIVTGESGDGKSTLSRQLMEEFLQATVYHEGREMPYTHKGVIYTYEMAPVKETARMISSIGRIDSDAMKWGKFDGTQIESFRKASKTIAKFDLTIKNVSGKSVQWIIRDIRRRRRKLRPGQRFLAEVDYIQLVETDDKNHERRQLEIASITKKLHDICMTESIDIILPSQVNEDGKAREARDIKNDCDVKLDIVQEKEEKKKGGYDAYKSQDNKQIDDGTGIRKRIIKCDKNRDGNPDFSIKVKLIGPQFRFTLDL